MRKLPVRKVKKKERKHFCGECLREIGGHWLATKHLDDSSPICKAQRIPEVSPFQGEYLEFQVDLKTRDAIEESGLDPRNRDWWEHFPAADGNKPYKRWRGYVVR